jgi:hypothetical protein
MPHLISNLYEKAYTPFTAKLAPRHLWSKPQLGIIPCLLNETYHRKKANENY